MPTLYPQHHVHGGPKEAAAHPAARRQAGRQVETSVCAQLSGLASGQLIFASLDTKTQGASFC